MRTTIMVGLMLGTLAYLILQMGAAGMIVWLCLVGVPVMWFGKRKEPTPDQKRQRTTGMVLPGGGVLHGKKIITLAEAERRGLRLEYPEKPRRKPRSFWKVWS